MYGQPGEKNPYSDFNNMHGSPAGSMPPPPMMMPGAPTTGIPVNNNNNSPMSGGCNMTQQDLTQRLQESGHGQNVNAFNCYFVPGIMPPRCSCCERLIQEHPHRSGGGGGVNAPLMGGGIGLIMGGGAPDKPSFKTSPNGDPLYENSFLGAFAFVSIFLYLLATIMLVAFGASGLLAKSAVVIIGPCIMIFIGTVFSFIPSKSSIRFERSTSTIHYSKKKYVWFCCGETATIPYNGVQSVSQESSSVSINHVPQINIVMKCRDSNGQQRDLPLEMVGMFNAGSRQAGWTQALSEMGLTLQQ